MDKETGENEIVPEKNEDRIWREFRRKLMEEISDTASKSNFLYEKYKESKEDQITPADTHFAFASYTCQRLFNAFVLLDNAFDFLIFLEKRIDVKSAQLQKIILEMAERSNINMRTLKTEWSDVKNKMNNPMLTRIDDFLQKAKETEEKRRKLGGQYIE